MNESQVGTTMRVSLLHMEIKDTIKKNQKIVALMIEKAEKLKSDFICLPEYFSIPYNIESQQSAEKVFQETYIPTLLFLKNISKKTSAYIVGGSLIEKHKGYFYNTCYLIKKEKIFGTYRKIHLTPGEKNLGLKKGRTTKVFDTEFCKVGILICADIFYPRTVKKLSNEGAEVIFLPVSASPTHPSVKGHPLSLKRAKNNLVYILKNGNIKSKARGGSTAIISPWGVLNEATNKQKPELLTTDLNLKKIRDYRQKSPISL